MHTEVLLAAAYDAVLDLVDLVADLPDDDDVKLVVTMLHEGVQALEGLLWVGGKIPT